MAALDLIAQDVFAEYGSTLPSVSGPNPASDVFADRWHSLSGQAYRLGIAMRIYRLDHVCPVTGVGGEARRVTVRDRDLLLDWIYSFQSEALGNTDVAQSEASVNRWLRWVC